MRTIPSRAAKLAAALLLACAGRVRAQCPDGTPPPCGGRRAPALDPARIAILPFRVAAADTLLGQGLAELLAPEFTGENGPLAVNMGTVLRAWKRAGGGASSPLDQAEEQRLAREVGAGLVVDGSVVGLGSTITLAASVTELPRGTTRRVGPLSGSADSLPSLVGRLASALIGATGSAPVDLQIRLTDSPAAMRAYLEALAQFRNGNFERASAAFERAYALDTLFARAALMRFVTGQWSVGVGAWDSITWKRRDRLSEQDRIYLTAKLGDHFPSPRSPAAGLADRRRAASLLPESAEAQFELADYLYHSGSATDIADDFASARAQLELAYRLDPQFEPVAHLVGISLFSGDTVLLRRSWSLFERMRVHDPLLVAFGRVVARVLGDPDMTARYGALEPSMAFLADAASLAALAADDVARVFDLPAGADAPTQPTWQEGLVETAINTGRLSQLVAFRRRGSWAATRIDKVLVEAALFAGADSSAGAAAASRLANDPRDVAPFLLIEADCARALWQVASGSDAPVDTAVFAGPDGSSCVAAIAVLRALELHRPDLRARTEALDSLTRWAVANLNEPKLQGFEGLLLARAWQALGDPARALAAARLGTWEVDPSHNMLAPANRLQCRLAAGQGDTTAAVRACRRYLRFRRDADPAFAAQRDSVANELALLSRASSR